MVFAAECHSNADKFRIKVVSKSCRRSQLKCDPSQVGLDPAESAIHTRFLIYSLLPTRSQTGDCAKAFVALSLEEKLAPEFLVVLIEPGPELSFSPVYLASL